MTNPVPNPLNSSERALLAKVYKNYGTLNGTTEEKLKCLQKHIGANTFACGPNASPELNLLAYERIYLLTRGVN
jgi:hypothetical protein